MFTSSIFISVYKFIVLKKSSFAYPPPPTVQFTVQPCTDFLKKFTFLGTLLMPSQLLKDPNSSLTGATKISGKAPAME